MNHPNFILPIPMSLVRGVGVEMDPKPIIEPFLQQNRRRSGRHGVTIKKEGALVKPPLGFLY